MRIAFLTNFIPPYRRTFYEKLCQHHPHMWRIIRGRVHTETGRPEYSGALAMPVTDVRNIEYHIGPLTLRWQSGALAAVKAHKPDVVVLLGMVGNVSNWFVLAWARLTGRKVVIWACGWEPAGKGGLVLAVKRSLMCLFFNRANRLLLYSTKGLEYLASAGVKRELMKVCYNGVEIDDALQNEADILIQAAALRSRLGAELGPIFLYVGALQEGKRLELLLRSFQSVRYTSPLAALWIVGGGPQSKALRAMVVDEAIAGVTFFGRIVEGVNVYFAAADIFVLPGLGGLAFNEAMFWRKPCIGSEADGTEEDLLIPGQTGIRFVAGDQHSLTGAMLTASAMAPEALQAMGQAARRLITDRSNVNVMVQTFVREIEDL